MNVQQQLERFEKGYPPRKLLRPAVAGDGVRRLRESEARALELEYENSLSEKSVCKFVPASGAASRMFGDLGMLRDVLSSEEAALDPEGERTLERFLSNIEKFPFAGPLEREIGKSLEEAVRSGDSVLLLDKLLGSGGLGYGDIPKGLVPFHDYGGEPATAFFEHFREALGYAASGGRASVHFTIPPAFAGRFAREAEEAVSFFSSSGVSFDVSWSAQDPATDTVAVGTDNVPVLDSRGVPLRRPAGHGALLGNLDALFFDCVFIKNIDNVAKEELLSGTIKWKKILGGLLFSLQERIFGYCEALFSGRTTKSLEREIVSFCREELSMDIPRDAGGERLFRELQRPLRVCGVVRNEGEPGGGPFWVEKDGAQSLQIVESAEVDMSSPSQLGVWKSSTHFNPVDIVCGVKDFRGEKFDLARFVDREAGIITEKSLGSRRIRAIELPGLWNGSMSGWLTVFVEVPSVTFNPVKTVWDLLKQPHQVE